MTRFWEALERPARIAERVERSVRTGREGTYWQAADGLVVRLAAAEEGRRMEDVQRELLALAVRDALEQEPRSATPDARPGEVAQMDRAAVFAARAEGNGGRTGA